MGLNGLCSDDHGGAWSRGVNVLLRSLSVLDNGVGREAHGEKGLLGVSDMFHS